MAQNTKKPQNSNQRNTQNTTSTKKRPQRPLSSEEAAKLRAQQEHDHKVQTTIGIVAVVVIVLIVGVIGFIIWWTTRPPEPVDVNALKSDMDKVQVKPADMTDSYGFLISKDGLNKPVANVPSTDVYMDFMCPACGAIDRTMDDTWIKMVEAGQLNLVVHPLAFLDRLSSDEYSSRAASMATYIAENDPDHLLAFIKAMFGEDFQPQEGAYQPVSDQQIADLAVKAGVDKQVATDAMKETYKPWIQALSQWTPYQKNLQNVSGSYKGEMTTPTLLINNKFWDFQNIMQTVGSQDLVTLYSAAVGLGTQDIGNADVLPSIGATNPAIEIKAPATDSAE
jgi:protein-disulfide isomerase